ncbi:MAG TPA: PDZ domain-containing protein [Acidimicrobiales bacterium]|nr:PDZ domain-containing protein [Acidimicrobiales bacterium]
MADRDRRWGWWPRRRRRPGADARPWVHPSELPRFEDLEPRRPSPRSRLARAVALLAAVLLVAGGAVLEANRGSTPTTTTTHRNVALSALPSNARAVAADTVNLTIITNHGMTTAAALVLPGHLAVTTVRIPVNALVKGTNARHVDFAVSLVGRDDVMGFSVVRLGAAAAPVHLDPMPASAAVTVVAPVVPYLLARPRYDWAVTTLGDPQNDSQGVVRYLTTPSGRALWRLRYALAVDARGRVVAVLSANHQWYGAQFVARVAEVLDVGRGCHGDLGMTGASVQGGGVRLVSVAPYGPAAHAGLRPGDVLMTWSGRQTDDLAVLRSMIYLTPAYTNVKVTYLRGSALRTTTVTPVCPFRVTP